MGIHTRNILLQDIYVKEKGGGCRSEQDSGDRFLRLAEPECWSAIGVVDLIDWIFEAEFAGADNEEDAGLWREFFEREQEGLVVHEVHFSVIGADIPSAVGNKIAVFVKPAIWVIVQCHEGDDVRYVHISGGAEDCVVLVESGAQPLAGLDKVDEETLIDSAPAIIFAIEVVEETCIRKDYRHEEDGGDEAGRFEIFLE